MVKAVVFDMDDTIFYPQLPFERALKAICPLYAGDVAETYHLFRRVSDKEFERVLRGECDTLTFQKIRFKKTMEQCAYEAVTDEQAADFQRCYLKEQEKIEMLAGIKETFDYLRAHNIKIGLLTNGPTQHQWKKIEYLKLREYIEENHILVSQETGFAKPDKEIFDLMAARLVLTADDLLYVGDNCQTDILGGLQSGWRTIWINHKQEDVSAFGEFSTAFVIASHEELLATIEQLIP